MTKITRRTFAATAAAAAATTRSRRSPGWSDRATYPTRPVTIVCPWGAGGGTDATARIVAALLEKELGPAVQRRQPHRRLRRRRPFRDRDRRAGRLHARHHHGRDRDDALAGPDRAQADQLHAAGADERGSAGHPGESGLALQDRQGTGRRDQGGARRQVQGLRHRPGRHLASRAGRLAQGAWASTPNHVAWVPSNGAAPAMQDLAAGGLDLVTCSVPEARAMIEAGKARSLAIMAPAAQSAIPQRPDAEGGAWASTPSPGAWRGFAAPKSLPADRRKALGRAQEGLRLEGLQDFMNNRGFGMVWADAAGFAKFMDKARTRRWATP